MKAWFRKYRVYGVAIVLAAGVGLLVWAVDHGQIKGWVEILCAAACLSTLAVITAHGRRNKVLWYSMLCVYCLAYTGFLWAEHKSSFPAILLGLISFIWGWSAVDAYRSSRKSCLAAAGASRVSGEFNRAGNS
jgi:hypothetical protein